MCKYQKNRASDAFCSVCLLKTFKITIRRKAENTQTKRDKQEKSRIFTSMTGWALIRYKRLLVKITEDFWSRVFESSCIDYSIGIRKETQSTLNFQ